MGPGQGGEAVQPLYRMVGRLTYANVVATVALFVALGGASYAAVAIPANSVNNRKLSFPLGLKSAEKSQAKLPVYICPVGAHCPKLFLRPLLSLHVSLKKSSRLLVLAQSAIKDTASPKSGNTAAGIALELDHRPFQTERYRLSTTNTPVGFYGIVSARPGAHNVSLEALSRSRLGPSRSTRFDHPDITVIALPPLQ